MISWFWRRKQDVKTTSPSVQERREKEKGPSPTVPSKATPLMTKRFSVGSTPERFYYLPTAPNNWTFEDTFPKL